MSSSIVGTTKVKEIPEIGSPKHFKDGLGLPVEMSHFCKGQSPITSIELIIDYVDYMFIGHPLEGPGRVRFLKGLKMI